MKNNNKPSENREHHTLLEDLRESFEKLNTEFPLSGGETDEDLEQITHTEKEKHEKTSFFDDLDTEFPLSGGEIER